MGKTMDEATTDKAVPPPTARDYLVELLGIVNEAMTESVVEVSPEAPVSVALAILDRHRVGGAPVVHAGRVVGVVTITDLVGRRTSAQHTGPFLRPNHEAREWSVADVMSEIAMDITRGTARGCRPQDGRGKGRPPTGDESQWPADRDPHP
jgi:hypothetical protein